MSDVRLKPKPADIAALLVAMTFPSVMSWLEFMILPGAGRENVALQVTFGIGKFIQFSFPILYVWFFRREELAVHKPSARGLKLGAAFGLVVGAGALILYFTWLKTTPALAETPQRVHDWLTEFNLATPSGYLGMAFFIAVLHSFLEEYYWRWFVFGRLEKYLPLAVAMGLSSCAFMAHHVIVLSVYLHGYFWEAVVPFSLCVAGGGVVWAWLYHRCRSLYAPWVSHLLVDLALMALGYDMLAKYW
jgi:membrane protease YdiL (CAAX protease family)